MADSPEKKETTVNIAMIYAIAALLALIVAAPVALLAPIFFAVTIPMPVDSFDAPTETIVEQGDNEADTVPMVSSCAPFVRVYAGRGESRPAVYAWSLCQSTPTVHPLTKAGKPLRGAALRAATAKAGRIACVSHACPTVRL